MLFSLLFGSVGVFAQAPEPPEGLPYHDREHPVGEINTRYQPYDLEQRISPDIPFPRPISAPTGADSPSVALGQPGLSFRYVQTFGISEEGYLSDGYHLNAPSGLYIDGSNNLYVVEDHGHRLLRYNASGNNTLSLGLASFCQESNNPTGFCMPQDVALDSGGNIWVATGNRVVKFNSSGVFQMQLPEPDSNGHWWSGNDDTHFRRAGGIAFDNTNNHMFVADSYNHRVQVYTFSGGSPVYSATIGETGVSGSDNSHFNSPRRLAVDSSGRLYVVDRYNSRLMRCSLSGTWSCSPFGTGMGTIYPRGIDVDNSDWVYIFENYNKRVIKCNSSTQACSDLITSNILYTQDVAVDSGGNIYTGAYGHSVIRKYNSSGTLIGDPYIGTWHMSYFTDGSHIFSPWAVAVAEGGSLYVPETFGYRLLKFNASGVQQWDIGDPGGWGDDNDQFSWLEGGPAIASNGKILVPDSGNDRIQIFNPDGTFDSTFGSYGTGNNQFKYPVGIAVSPLNGDIFVADWDNHRIQVYDSNLTWQTQLGVTGTSGSSSTLFNHPYDVTVDKDGDIYVADYYNYRVQKCSLNGGGYSCTTFAGVTGTIDDDGSFDYLMPVSVAVDGENRVYVADDWNNRVQVFDPSGAYLTSIGGSWGSDSGKFRAPVGIDIDKDGNVYVSEIRNNRVQKFAPGVPDWAQTNINAFGDNRNQNVTSLSPFKSNLYAGTYNWSGNGAQLWRKNGGSGWTSVTANGFGNSANVGINHLFEFKNNFYAATWADETNGGEVWRSSSGDSGSWTKVVSSGFGDATNGEVFRLAEFNNRIYASTVSFTDTHGTEIWRSSSGDSGSWSRVVNDGFDGDSDNVIAMSLEVFNGYMYAGTYNWVTGTEIWRSSNGDSGSWGKINTDGFGDQYNFYISLNTFNGYLYAGTYNYYDSDNPGAELWRCQTCDGTDWTELTSAKGFGDPENRQISSLVVFNNSLYAFTHNRTTGIEVWCSNNGTDWEQVNIGGFGDSLNYNPYWDNSTTVFNNALYVGTRNNGHGGEVWVYLGKRIFLPLTMR